MELSKGFDCILHDLNIQELTILGPVLVIVSTFDYSNNKTLQTITTFSTWTNASSDLLKNYVTQTKSAIEWFTHNKMMVNPGKSQGCTFDKKKCTLKNAETSLKSCY